MGLKTFLSRSPGCHPNGCNLAIFLLKGELIMPLKIILNQQIEKLRDELNQLARYYSLDDSHITTISSQIDNLVMEYMKLSA